MLQVNDIIPLGIGKGVIALIANDNGLKFLPPHTVKDRKCGDGYWDVEVSVDENNKTNIVALLLIGVKDVDIRKAIANAK